MAKWIPINLPWSRSNRKVEALVARKRRQVSRLYCQAFHKAEQTFGQTLQEAEDMLTAARMTNLKRRHPGWVKSELIYAGDLDQVKRRYPVLDVNLTKDPPDCCDAAWLAEVKQVAKRSPVALALGEYYHCRYQRWLLSGQTPECRQAEALENEIQAMIKTSVFHGILGNDHPLCRPGVLLEVRHRKTHKVEQLLIGHLGTSGGPDQWEMGDQVIEEDDLVLRAKVVWEEGK
jgi:hypothetical protein